MKRAFGLIVSVLLLSACAGGGGLQVIEPPAELTEIVPELKVERIWSADVGSGTNEFYLNLGPLVDGERVFAADAEGRVYAFDAESGRELWQIDLEANISSAPGDGGTLILLGGDAEVYALAKEDGSVRWRAPVSGEVLAAPTRSGQKVLARSVDGNLFALDVTSGEQLWRYAQAVPTLSLRGQAAPVPFGNYAAIGYANGRLVAVELDSGAPVWESTVAVPRGRTDLERMVDVDSTPVIRDGVAHVAAFQGRVATIALRDGEVIWAREIPSHQPVASTEQQLFVTDDSSDLWSLSRYNGGTLWRTEALHARRLTAPVVQGNYLLVGDLDGYLHWLAQDDGRLVARVSVGGERILAAPVVAANRVYAIDVEGRLAAFDVAVAGN